MNQQILHILFSASPQCYPQSAEIQALFWVLKERARPQSRASYLPPSEVFRQYGLSGNGDPWCSPQSAPSPHNVADAAARVAEPVRHSPLSSIAANQTIRPARRSVTRWVAPRGGPEGRADIRSLDRRLAGNRASGARRQPRRCSASRFGDKVGARADFWGRLTASSQFRGEERESIGSKTRCTTANGCTAPRYCQSASQSHGSLGRHSSQQVRWQ